MRIALAQVNPTVGDLEGNTWLVIRCIEEARKQGAGIVVFPELVISGYPPEDLLLTDHFLRDCRACLDRVQAVSHGIIVILGVPLAEEGGVANAAVVVHDGRIAAVYRKIRLPNYAVFDEERYFRPGDKILVLRSASGRLAVNVCEDVWSPCGPGEEAALVGGAKLIVNLSMSPYHVGKGAERQEMLSRRAADAGAFLVYVNGVGGQDELVFDGHSLVLAPDGWLIGRGPQFEEALLLVDLDLEEAATAKGSGQASHFWPIEEVVLAEAGGAAGMTPAERFHGEADASAVDMNAGASSWSSKAPVVAEPRQSAAPSGQCRPDGASTAPAATSGSRRMLRAPRVMSLTLDPGLARPAEVYAALELGVRDYVDKNRFQRVVIGVSGGVDSALTACVAADALGSDRVTGVSMPSRYTSAATRADARVLAENLGIGFLELPIEGPFQAYLDVLEPVFEELAPDTTEENIQARIRGNFLMALSNKFGWLVLTTGNKSEMAVGYATLYGDMAGGFAVLKDVPKTMVYELATYRNSLGGPGPIPEATLERAPSAELRLGQTDQDTLPPYEILDQIVAAYVVRDESLDEIVARGIDRATAMRVIAMIDRNEYKRRQAPPGIKVTSKAFGKDRRFPITNRFRG